MAAVTTSALDSEFQFQCCSEECEVNARGLFWFAFFVGSGAGRIVVGQVPAVYEEKDVPNSFQAL
eukprot:CAMPEP_0172483530 /NCGR_PEP_ID=MMETSP1066-20121228/10527_1 /TAXON_ID=671091 /ORGANISM="Coscinodiscus wailesii, Strain CCMP2513" /LENGTH=64 /DNA_ID=CAMNT_0013247439 /DNA_START=380 /DNA_END=574 /DNA_ORIENTATION=+